MEIDLRKPNEWVGIANEPNYKFAIVHVLLFKGHARLPCFAPIPLCLTMPCPICLALPCPIRSALPCPKRLALPCLALPTLWDKNRTLSTLPLPNPNLYVSCVEATIVAWLLSDYIDTCTYTPRYLPALVELHKNPLVVALGANNNYMQWPTHLKAWDPIYMTLNQ